MGNQLNCISCTKEQKNGNNSSGNKKAPRRLRASSPTSSTLRGGKFHQQEMRQSGSGKTICSTGFSQTTKTADCSTAEDLRSSSFKFSPDKIHPRNQDLKKNGLKHGETRKLTLIKLQSKDSEKTPTRERDLLKFNTNTSSLASSTKEFEFDYDSIPSLKKINSITDQYKLGRLLGQGTYGRVRKATHIESGLVCAIKIVKK